MLEVVRIHFGSLSRRFLIFEEDQKYLFFGLKNVFYLRKKFSVALKNLIHRIWFFDVMGTCADFLWGWATVWGCLSHVIPIGWSRSYFDLLFSNDCILYPCLGFAFLIILIGRKLWQKSTGDDWPSKRIHNTYCAHHY